MRLKHKKGFGLVEIIVGAAILSVTLVAISAFFQKVIIASRATRAQVQSGYLLEEGVEAIKTMRDQAYSTSLGTFSSTTTYYLSWNSTTKRWDATTTNALIDNVYERKFTVSNVKRDSVTSDISASGTTDTNTKLVNVTVSWKPTDSTATSSRSVAFYLMNIFSN